MYIISDCQRFRVSRTEIPTVVMNHDFVVSWMLAYLVSSRSCFNALITADKVSFSYDDGLRPNQEISIPGQGCPVICHEKTALQRHSMLSNVENDRCELRVLRVHAKAYVVVVVVHGLSAVGEYVGWSRLVGDGFIVSCGT